MFEIIAINEPIFIFILLFVTGMDIKDIRTVVHFGPPSSVDQYLQETGRGGRDGLSAYAVLIKHKYSLSGKVEDDMKEYIKSEKCRRHSLLSVFQESPTLQSSPACCDICTGAHIGESSCCSCSIQSKCFHKTQTCYCVRWCGVIHPLELTIVNSDNETVSQEIQRSSVDETELRLALLQIRSECHVLPSNVSNLYPELVDALVRDHIYVKDVDDVMRMGALSRCDAHAIFEILDRLSHGSG